MDISNVINKGVVRHFCEVCFGLSIFDHFVTNENGHVIGVDEEYKQSVKSIEDKYNTIMSDPELTELVVGSVLGSF